MGHFSWLGHLLHIDHHYVHVAHAALIALLMLLLGLIVRIRLRNTEKHLVPASKLSLINIFEVACEGLLTLMEGILGHEAKRYFPFVASLFIFIFLNNLLGVIPGFLPPTDNFNTTFALGIAVFVYFNYVGLKTQGLAYLKHFMGPVIFLAPLMLVVEIIGVFVRPLSLALRLAGNMTGDHMVLGIFSDLVPVVVPVVFLALGVFVSFIQAFVFSLLSTIYVGLSLPHEEHH
ncbi:MAG: F0F1 ATP synthase subunit A [Deltaproteobacteria bacterium]|nr:F0F1 ATP synthase subunit A [Deltaproteobacteria bacterium]